MLKRIVLRFSGFSGSTRALWLGLCLLAGLNLSAQIISGGGSVPVITQQPQSQTVTVGATATFNVIVTGTPPFTYQWRRNGRIISGATADTYTTPATVLSDNGSTFSVSVSSGFFGVTSANATLTVNASVTPPTISSFTPASGPVGTSVIITGTNFTGATAVKFNATAAIYTVNSATQITATVPTGATTGLLSVTTPGGTASSSGSFTITTSVPVISYSPNTVAFSVGIAISPMNPTNTGGAAVSWSITPALPAGLSLSLSTGQISGTPTVASTATAYTVTASNAAGSGTAVVNITINAGPPIPSIGYSPNNASLNVGTPMVPMTPNNIGGAATSWSISPALSAGLSISTSTGVISGTPTVAKSITGYTVTASNASGNGTATVTITVTGPSQAPVISYSPSAATFTVGTAITPMTPANTGGAATSWSISPALSAGLSFAASTGVISGTPTVAQAATAYIVTAANAYGSGTAVVNITINAGPPIPSIGYSPNNASLNVGTPMVPMTPNNIGGAATSWSISPALSAGLSISTSTGVISGTPTAAKAITGYTVTASNASGNGIATVTITVTGPSQAPVISYSPSAATFTVGTAITPMTPANTGGAATSWSISPALSAGLSFGASTGVISGTPTVAQAATAYIVTAANAYGSGTAGVNITVNAGSPAPTITGFTPTSGPAGTSVAITGTNFTGATTVGFTGVAATFTVNSATQITATVPSGATSGTISVTTPGGTATSAGVFTVTPTTITITLSPTAVSMLVGGPQALAATVSGTPNTAVTWTASGGAITGTGLNVTWTAPQVAGTYTVTVISQADISKTATVTIRVNPAVCTPVN